MRFKFILVGIFITILFLSVPAFHYAGAVDFGQSTLKGVAGSSGYETTGGDTELSQRVGQIIKIALSLVGMIFFALAVYAGFLWMTASGNEEKVTKAKDILMTATIGIIIALAAFSITAFVASRFSKVAGVSAGPQAGARTQQDYCAGLGREAYQSADNSDFGNIVDWFDGLVGSISCQVDPTTQEEIPGTCCMDRD